MSGPVNQPKVSYAQVSSKPKSSTSNSTSNDTNKESPANTSKPNGTAPQRRSSRNNSFSKSSQEKLNTAKSVAPVTNGGTNKTGSWSSVVLAQTQDEKPNGTNTVKTAPGSTSGPKKMVFGSIETDSQPQVNSKTKADGPATAQPPPQPVQPVPIPAARVMPTASFDVPRTHSAPPVIPQQAPKPVITQAKMTPNETAVSKEPHPPVDSIVAPTGPSAINPAIPMTFPSFPAGVAAVPGNVYFRPAMPVNPAMNSARPPPAATGAPLKGAKLTAPPSTAAHVPRPMAPQTTVPLPWYPGNPYSNYPPDPQYPYPYSAYSSYNGMMPPQFSGPPVIRPGAPTTPNTTTPRVSTGASPNIITTPTKSKAIKIVNPLTMKEVDLGKVSTPEKTASVAPKPVTEPAVKVEETPKTEAVAITSNIASAAVDMSNPVPAIPPGLSPRTSVTAVPAPPTPQKNAVSITSTPKKGIVLKDPTTGQVKSIGTPVRIINPETLEPVVKPKDEIKVSEPVIKEAEKKTEVPSKPKSKPLVDPAASVKAPQPVEINTPEIPSEETRPKSPIKRTQSPTKQKPAIKELVIEKKEVATPEQPKPKSITKLASVDGIKYPTELKAPTVEKGVFIYNKEFLLAFQSKCLSQPDGLPSVQDLISADQSASPRTGGPKSAKGGSIGKGQGFAGMGIGGRGIGSGSRGGVPLGSKSSRSSAPRRQPSRGDSRGELRDGRDSNRGSRYPPMEPIEPLVPSENAWKPKDRNTSTDAAKDLECKTRGILNRITPEKFERLSDQVLDLPITNEEMLAVLINTIFDKALTEQHYAKIYSQLCRKLSDNLPVKYDWISMEQKNNVFRRALLNKCQEEFQRGEKWAAEDLAAREQAKKADQMTEEEKEKFLNDQVERIKLKIRTLGNIRFIGELFKLGMITEKIMHGCVVQLIAKNVKDPEEEDIESLCKLLKTVGRVLDTKQAAGHMNAYFHQIADFSKNMKLPSRIRFMLQDLLELRQNKWVDRKEEAGPKTIAEIRQEVEKKAQMEKEQSDRGRSSMSGRRDLPNLRDQFGSKRGRASQDNRLGSSSDGWSTVGGAPMKAGGSQSAQSDLASFGKLSASKSDKESLTFGPAGGTMSGGAKGWKSGASTQKDKPNTSDNMFGLLSDQAERRKSIDEKPRSASPVAPKPKVDTKKRIPGLIAEWFGLFDIGELCLSLEEIDSEYHVEFLTGLLEKCIDKNEDTLKKTANMLIALVEKDLVSNTIIQSSFEPLVEMSEDFIYDVPHLYKNYGLLFSGLILGNALTMQQVLELACILASGSNPGSSKMMGYTLGQVCQLDKKKTVVWVNESRLKTVLGQKSVDDAVFKDWLNTFNIVIPPHWSNVIAVKLAEESVDSVIEYIENMFEKQDRDDAFVSDLVHGFLAFVTSQTIYRQGEKPAEITRNTFIEMNKIVEETGKPLLSTFVDDSIKERKLAIVKGCHAYCQHAHYPKSLMENLFRVFLDNEIVDEQTFKDWKSSMSHDKEALKQVDRWFKSLEAK